MSAIGDLAALIRAGAPSFTVGFSHRIRRGHLAGLHRHAGFEIVYHPSGRGRSRLASGGEIAFAPGDVLLYAPRLAHDQSQDVTGEDCCIQFMVAGALPRALPACFHLPRVADPWLRRELRELSDRPAVSAGLDQLGLDLRVGAVLVRLLADAEAVAQAAPASVGDGHAELADRYIAEHFRDLGRLEEVATALGIGYDHLRHIYRRRYGRSLVRRLIEARVERAKTLLAHAPLPVTDVAGEVGYATARHFATVFKGVAGCTPAAYRAAARR